MQIEFKRALTSLPRSKKIQ